MSIQTELRIDRDRCSHCGRLLHQHVESKRKTERLIDLDGLLCLTLVWDITCGKCKRTTSIAYSGEGMSRWVQAVLPGCEPYMNVARIPHKNRP